MTTPIEDQLDEILNWYYLGNEDKYMPGAWDGHFNQAKAQLLDLIAHLASEAKPEKRFEHKEGQAFSGFACGHDKGFNDGADTYHNNILKALRRET